MSADAPIANDFETKLEKKINEEKLVPNQVSGTGLNFKCLPQTNFSLGNLSSASGYKLNKECITVVTFGSNASGTLKHPLLSLRNQELSKTLMCPLLVFIAPRNWYKWTTLFSRIAL